MGVRVLGTGEVATIGKHFAAAHATEDALDQRQNQSLSVEGKCLLTVASIGLLLRPTLLGR